MAAIAAQGPAGGVTDPPRPAAPFPSRVLHQDEPFQRHQPFYIPNTQPVLPYQWPMSAPYVPYTGFPGLGYGMMMPPLLFPPCVEVPGYVTPHAQLHMLDYYRRVINPHVAPNISHQAQRFRFQNSVPLNRMMVNSEVQTEPTSHNSSQNSRAGSESGRGTGCDSPVSVSASFSENKSVACSEETPVFSHNRVVATNTINTSNCKSEILLQAERVQIKCSETPSTFKIIRTNETTELASNDAGDLLQCSLGSIRSEDVVLCSYQSLAFRKDKQGIEARNLRYSRKHCLPACKEVASMSPSCSVYKEYSKLSRSKRFEAHSSSEMQIHKTCNHMKCKQDTNSHNVNCKILRLPFGTQTCQLEASVWSVESLLPHVPSSDWLIRNKCEQDASSSHNVNPQILRLPFETQTCQLEASVWSVESLVPYVPSSDWLVRNESKQDTDCHNVNFKILRLPFKAQTCQLEASVWSVESLVPYVPSSDWLVRNGLVTPQKSPEGDAVPVEKNQQTDESIKPHGQDLHRSRSPYRPSTSWLADFGNVYYYSKLPTLQRKPSGFGKSPEKQLHKTISPELSPLRHERKTRNQRSATRRSISDQKLCSCHSCRCTVKSPSRDPGRDVRFVRVSHFSTEGKIQHYSCQCNSRHKDHRKLSTSHSICCREEENAAVKTSDKQRPVHDAQKMVRQSSRKTKQREADLCEDCRCLHAGPPRNRCDECGPSVWEQNEEDCVWWRWREAQQRPQREISWTEEMQESDINDVRRRIQSKDRLMREGGKILMGTCGQRSHPMNPVKAH